MPPKGSAAPLIRDLPPVVDLRPVPKEPTPATALRTRVVASPPGPDGRPRAPRREVELGVEGYPGFTIWLWANYPKRVRDELLSNDEATIIARLPDVLVAHNGWSDADGEPYPPADDPGFFHALPSELGFLVMRLVLLGAPTAYPNSLTATGAS